MGTISHPSERQIQTTLPASFWRGLILVALLLGVAWINYSRISANFQGSTSTASTPIIGVVIGVGGVLFLLSRVQVASTAILDNLMMVSIGALIMLALGQFAMGVPYGMSTELPWGVTIWGVRRHPVQLYEAAALLLIFIVLWRMMPSASPGEVFWRGLLYLGATELVLEAFRAISRTTMAGIRVPQVAALTTILISLYIISFHARQRQQQESGHLA